jgi:hypothetical protein
MRAAGSPPAFFLFTERMNLNRVINSLTLAFLIAAGSLVVLGGCSGGAGDAEKDIKAMPKETDTKNPDAPAIPKEDMVIDDPKRMKGKGPQ